MILDNFSLGADSVTLERDGLRLDLHNDYDFKTLHYDVAGRRLELAWQRNAREWVSKDLPLGLRLAFTGVYLLKARGRDPAIPFTEDDCLASLGFFWNEMTDDLTSLAKRTPEAGCDHLNLAFQSGFALKIGAEQLRLVLDPK